LDRGGTDLVEMLRSTRGEIIQIKPREPFALTGTGSRRLLTYLGRPYMDAPSMPSDFFRFWITG
jgi:hypothetical protein